jgi:hypothetical protein
MKTLTYLTRYKEYKYFQLVGDKLTNIDSLIDWKYFRIIFEVIY